MTTSINHLNMPLPELPLEAWQDTLATLHMWTQVVGKVRLELTPMINHWWQVPFYLTSRGMTTSPIPYRNKTFDIDFDFIDHALYIRTSEGQQRILGLLPRTVADFYHEFMSTLHEFDIDVSIWPVPVEIPNPIPFREDVQHASYNHFYVHRWWQAMCFADQIMKAFRGNFIGKSSPVHFFWGGFDLAVTRFSSRRAPVRYDWSPALERIMREAYSHEVSSVGFWPGGGDVAGAAFYCYHTPEPAGFRMAAIEPAQAFYDEKLGEYLLMYDDVRQSANPAQMVMDFFQSTYDAGATLAGWDRESLERNQTL